MAEISLTRAITPSAAQLGSVLCASVLLSAVLLQKVALPATRGVYPLNLVIFPAVATLSFVFGVLQIDTVAFLWYALFVLAGALGAAVAPTAHPSFFSFGFFLWVLVSLG